MPGIRSSAASRCVLAFVHDESKLTWVGISQVKKWGFDCYAIDLIDGPAPILSYLCESAKMHAIVSSFRLSLYPPFATSPSETSFHHHRNDKLTRMLSPARLYYK